jgi:hypothetical protein
MACLPLESKKGAEEPARQDIERFSDLSAYVPIGILDRVYKKRH